HQPPIISATHPARPPAHQPPIISATEPARPPAHQPPIISAKHPELFHAHQSPTAQDTQVTDTQTTTHLPRISANHAPLVTTPRAHQLPQTPDVLVLRAQTTQLPVTPTVQPPLTITPRSPVAPAHRVPVPAATQLPALPTPLPSQSPTNQTSPSSPTHPHSKAPQVPREGAPEPKLAPWLPSVDPTTAPTALGEASLAGHSPRDDRWLLVALLVPTCVFLVVLLALGIVYCTRCGPHAPNKSVTDCYRWVTHAGSKSSMEPAPPRGSLTGVQTCRTSV
uniref:CD248 molecule n=2 Tax=Loxodonta africana TaxID=9785 RepID=G3U2M8_LOXAF